MSSAGGGFTGPSLSRGEWRGRVEKAFPGIRLSGGQGRLERGGGSIQVELASGDPVAELDIRWTGVGPAGAVRRFLAEQGLQAKGAAALRPMDEERLRNRQATPTRRRLVVTACLAATGCACLLLSLLLAARPYLNARLMAYNEQLALKRLGENPSADAEASVPVYAGYIFEPVAGSARHAVHARPLLPGVTGGGWFISMDGRIYRDPEFDRLAALQEEQDEP